MWPGLFLIKFVNGIIDTLLTFPLLSQMEIVFHVLS